MNKVLVKSVEILTANEKREALAVIKVSSLAGTATFTTFEVEVAQEMDQQWIEGSIVEADVVAYKFTPKTGKNAGKAQNCTTRRMWVQQGQTLEAAAKLTGSKLQPKEVAVEAGADKVEL